MRRIIIDTITIIVMLFALPSSAFAASLFTATPAVIDGKGKPREILHFSVTIVNTTKHLVSIYPWVTDIDRVEGSAGGSDLEGSRDRELGGSLARWIEISRGSIDLLPGEQKEVPVTVQINLNAKPGLYHAAIHLSAGSDRPNAEANRAETMDTTLNIEVLDDINERLQLNTFVPTKNVFGGDSASFDYTIENIGNRGEVPRGKIRIYDKAGREVASIDANDRGSRLEPAAKAQLSSVWAAGGSFGRYKAMLDLEYGARGTLQDTVFFWVIPWKKVLAMFFSLIVLSVAIAIVLHSYGQSRRRSALLEAPERSRFASFFPWGRDDDEDEEAWEEVEVHRPSRAIDELREVPPPPPVHTRLHSESSPHSSYLPERERPDLSSHQVVLGKKEAPHPGKAHIVNLKR